MSHSLPKDLRDAIENDSRPVRPLSPAWKRSLWAAGVATLVVVLSLVLLGARSDIDQIPIWLSWGSCFVQLGLGIVLIGLALRESVPGFALPAGVIVFGVVFAFVLQVGVGYLTWRFAPGMIIDPWAIGPGLTCMSHDALLVLPTFVLTLVLVFRALPLRAPLAGIMGGAGSAMAADAVNHLLCPASDMRHVLVWHTGAIVIFIVIGWGVGVVWERFRWRNRQP
jgi:hypothetical protein